MFRREPIVDRYDDRLGAPRHRPAEAVVRVEVAEYEAAAVREHHRRRGAADPMRAVDPHRHVAVGTGDQEVVGTGHIPEVGDRRAAPRQERTRLGGGHRLDGREPVVGDAHERLHAVIHDPNRNARPLATITESEPEEVIDGRAEPAARLRLHRSRDLRQPAAHGGVRRGPPHRADLVERAATRCRRIRRRWLLGGQQAPRRPRGVAAQRRVLVGQEVDRAALQGGTAAVVRSRRARCR